MNYIVEKKDLKGEIKGFPIEVVQKMVDNQVLQGNKANVLVFQHDATAPHFEGGFDWDETKEGYTFWECIIDGRKFDVFIKHFSNDKVYTCMLQDKSKHNANIIKHLEELGGKNTREFKIAFSDTIYYICPLSKTISTLPMNDDSFALLDMAGFHFVWCADDESIKEYTMEEIADALGIAVENLRIKK
jgi:hypothetical protein